MRQKFVEQHEPARVKQVNTPEPVQQKKAANPSEQKTEEQQTSAPPKARMDFVEVDAENQTQATHQITAERTEAELRKIAAEIRKLEVDAEKTAAEARKIDVEAEKTAAEARKIIAEAEKLNVETEFQRFSTEHANRERWADFITKTLAKSFATFVLFGLTGLFGFGILLILIHNLAGYWIVGTALGSFAAILGVLLAQKSDQGKSETKKEDKP